ncbi:hypothetical protein HBA54_22350 [Pelagibius litoralis]|uniref:V/A-type H+-transporting ATPase subunit E n=2 Tax=Pelagibius litoralis TaxID=374515 RepID=A0A967F1H5_9PROT|nr:hypothetical protein [Pelagibius litoralis]
MANKALQDQAMSSGVDALISRLREEGVAAGRAEAAQILGDAKAEAKFLLDKARADAQVQRETARKKAEAYRKAGEEALKTAMRDTVLDMKAVLMKRFSADVQRLVTRQLESPALLERMILDVAGRVRDEIAGQEDEPLEILLPESIVGLEELRNDPQELDKGQLTQFVLSLTGEMLREGVTFGPSDDTGSGITVRMKDQDVTLDLTDQAVAALILQHLQPRFRAVLEGIVK